MGGARKGVECRRPGVNGRLVLAGAGILQADLAGLENNDIIEGVVKRGRGGRCSHAGPAGAVLPCHSEISRWGDRTTGNARSYWRTPPRF